MIREMYPIIAVFDGKPSADPPPKRRRAPKPPVDNVQTLTARIATALGLPVDSTKEDVLAAIDQMKSAYTPPSSPDTLAAEMKKLNEKFDSKAPAAAV